MNVFGNALKYTNKGFIVVALSLVSDEDAQDNPAEEKTLEIKVTDTGKGISSEYLRTSLFNRKSTMFQSTYNAYSPQHFARRMFSPAALDLVYQLSNLLSLHSMVTWMSRVRSARVPKSRYVCR